MLPKLSREKIDAVAHTIASSLSVVDRMKVPRIRETKTSYQLRAWSVDVVRSAIPGISNTVAGKIAKRLRYILKLRKHKARQGRPRRKTCRS